MKLKINEELRSLIPPLQGEEKKLLENSLVEEGCRDSLIIWDGTIIDGHNRYELCTKNNISFEVKEMNFNDLSEAKNWMIDNQLARRNLTDSQRRYYIGKRYEEEKKPLGYNQHNRIGQNVQPSKPATDIAEQNNTSERTVRRNADYSKDIDSIRESEPELADDILTERFKATNKEVASFAKKEPSERKQIVDMVTRNKVQSIKEAEEIIKPKNVHVSNNSGNNEWYTPTKFIDVARKVMGSIDTDPASSEIANKNVKAKTFYTEESNGLEQEWQGNVWMNPPYAQPLIQQFSDKLVSEIDKGNVEQAMVLVNNATETRWFNTLSKKATAIWFVPNRIKFIDIEGNPSGAPLQGQAIIYFGDNFEKLRENCEGLVCRCSYA